MESDIRRLHQLRQEGKGCAQVLMQLALEMKGEDNPALIQAMSGLCIGVHRGLLCGCLTGAACMMSYFDSELAAEEMIPQLVEWFEENYGDKYGSMNCDDILEGEMANKVLRCPNLMEQTYREAREILAEYGYDLEEMMEN